MDQKWYSFDRETKATKIFTSQVLGAVWLQDNWTRKEISISETYLQDKWWVRSQLFLILVLMWLFWAKVIAKLEQFIKMTSLKCVVYSKTLIRNWPSLSSIIHLIKNFIISSKSVAIVFHSSTHKMIHCSDIYSTLESLKFMKSMKKFSRSVINVIQYL